MRYIEVLRLREPAMVQRKEYHGLKRAAFTLMEMLVVVAIIVILAGVGVVLILPRLQESKEKIAYTRVKELTSACNMFELNNGQRPQALEQLTLSPQPNGSRRLVDLDAIIDPWGHPYQYDMTGAKNQGDRPDIWCVTPEGKFIGNWPALNH